MKRLWPPSAGVFIELPIPTLLVFENVFYFVNEAARFAMLSAILDALTAGTYPRTPATIVH
jgi:hypothetical protein